MLTYLAFHNLFRNPRRSLSVVITIAAGLSALLIFQGFNTGNINAYRESIIHSQYGHGQIETKGYLETVYEKPWEHWITNFQELKTKLLGFPGVHFLFPRMSFHGLVSNGSLSMGAVGQGINGIEEAQFFTELNIIAGANLTNETDGMILGSGLANSLGAKPGSVVTIVANTVDGTMNAIEGHVIGVFKTGRKDFDDNYFRIQLKQASLLLNTDRIETINIGLYDYSQWQEFERYINAQFPNLEALSLSVLDKVQFQNAVDFLKAQFRVIRIIILTIVLLGIFNTISTMILERKEEIGNLRANGESVNDVRLLLILEGLFLGLAGTLVGLLLTFIIVRTFLKNGVMMPPTPGLTMQFLIPIEIENRDIMLNSLISSLSAILATAVSAFGISRLPIVKLMRSI